MKRKMADRDDEYTDPDESPITALFLFWTSLSADSRYYTHCVNGKIVEVTTKYNPPLFLLGEGVYGGLYSAVKWDTIEHVAIKKITNAFNNKILARKALGEIKLYRHMKHNNIVSIKDVIPPPERNNFNDVYIVYECMDTDIHQLLKYNAMLLEEECQYLLCQILRGLTYMHSGNVMHGDLKPSHLLINRSNLDLKICNFGLQSVWDETARDFDYVGSRQYRAPELLLNSPNYDGAIDVWSVGCIYMEMLNQRPLFPGTDDNANQLHFLLQLLGSPKKDAMEFFKNASAKRQLSRLPFYPRQSFASNFPHINPLALDLVEKMLTFDPRRRITAEDALAHPYLAKYHDIKAESTCMAPIEYGYYPKSLTIPQAKEFIYMEAADFNPLYYKRM